MRTGKSPITNRRGQTMYVRYEPPASGVSGISGDGPGGLAILQHGYSGSMDHPLIRAMARTFRENGFATLSLDCTHSFNAADGSVEDHSIETHLHDLYDAVEWAKGQDWFTAPFALAGHSLGGFAVLDYAENNPGEVSLLFPCSAVTTGEKLAQAFAGNMPAGVFADWREKGFMEIEAPDGSGHRAKRPFSWLEDMKGYDALEGAAALTMPVLMAVGTDDIPTPPAHQLDLYGLLPDENKEMHILRSGDHPFSKAEHRRKLESITGAWLKKHT